MARLAELTRRGVIAVAGEDRIEFLQGLVSNDVAGSGAGQAVWAALLTPQGKWLADFFILSDGKCLLLDCERDQCAMLVQRLSRFRLRSRVAISPLDEWRVYAAWDAVPDADALIGRDPRLPEAGWRVLTPHSLPGTATEDEYDLHRLRLGLPDGSRDLEPDRTVLLEAGFDELNGVSWTKGCYMGQELTARTKYRGLVKRRIVPVEVDGPLPAPGSAILSDGIEVGTMRSGLAGAGLAVLRLDSLRAPNLACEGARVVPRVPGWMNVPAPQA
jgi:tRNA-modifying protein YgfZ